MQKLGEKDRDKKDSPVDLEKIFKQEKINIDSLLESRSALKDIQGTLSPYAGEFGETQKKHLLNRTMVGYATRHLKDLDGLTLEQTIDLVFSQHDLGEPINNYFGDLNAQEYQSIYGSEDVLPKQPFISRPIKKECCPDENSGPERHRAIDSWLYYNMYNQPTSIEWKLFIFLHNLTPVLDQNRQKPKYYHIKLLYEGAFRSYKDYIHDITLDPTMLDYLNLQLSRKETPDQNYAREVQELFTVGKRPFAKFTEDDVRAAARLLVGWRYQWDETLYSEGWEPSIMFDHNNHDTGDKQFSSFYNNTKIIGRQGQEGREELKEFIDMIFSPQEASIYLSRRLFQFFVYPVLSDDIEERIIKPLAEVMRQKNYNLSETLKVLLKSEYFYSSELYGALLKPPLEFTLGVYKELEILQGDLVYWDNQINRMFLSAFDEDKEFFDGKYFDTDIRIYHLFGGFQWMLRQQGMQLFQPPSVSGWPAYYQEPVYDLFWLNSVTIKAKKQVTEQVSRWGVYLDQQLNIRINLEKFIRSFDKPQDIDSFLSSLSRRFLNAEMPEKARIRIKKVVLGDGLNNNYWTIAVDEFLLSPKDRQKYNTLYWRLEQFLFQIFELNEIHIH